MQWMVRRAQQDDVRELARVNVASWRDAYRGIVPDDFLDGMDVARREAGWARWVGMPEPDAVFVAVDERRVAAYAAVCAAREESDRRPDAPTGELAAIYADPVAWGSGAGHAVHEAAIAGLAGCGFGHAILWVFEDNKRARRFYERHGWTCDGVREEFEVAGERPMEVRYSRPI